MISKFGWEEEEISSIWWLNLWVFFRSGRAYLRLNMNWVYIPPNKTSRLEPLQETRGRIIRVKLRPDYPVSVIFRFSVQISGPNIRLVPESRTFGRTKFLSKYSWGPDYPPHKGTGLFNFPGQNFFQFLVLYFHLDFWGSMLTWFNYLRPTSLITRLNCH